MTNEQQYLITRTRKLLLECHNLKQSLDGATKRRKALASKIKSIRDHVRQLEENLRVLDEETIPKVKRQLWEAERAANQSVKEAQQGAVRVYPTSEATR